MPWITLYNYSFMAESANSHISEARKAYCPNVVTYSLRQSFCGPNGGYWASTKVTVHVICSSNFHWLAHCKAADRWVGSRSVYFAKYVNIYFVLFFSVRFL